MISCPNKNSPQWKALEASVGTFEAFRDFMETDTIRSVEEVQEKLESENIRDEQYQGSNALLTSVDIANLVIPQDESFSTVSVNQLKNSRAVELANKMSTALGIDYEGITPEEATELTKTAENPWSGEPAFFYKNRVYFLADRISSDNVFHEFSHPVVRAIAKDNPQLFNNLYAQLTGSEIGYELISEVAEKYPELDVPSERFQEEVLVHALTQAGMMKMGKDKYLTGLDKAIKNILYAIKQLLRKVFGTRIPVSKLDVDTSIDELADILSKGDAIDIDTQLVSEEDIVAYKRETHKEVASDLQSVEKVDIIERVNTFHDVVSMQLNMLLKNENYEALAEILDQGGEMKAIRSNLNKWQTTIRNKAESLQEDIADSRSRVQAFTNSLFRLRDVLSKVYEHTKDISQYPNTQENMHKAYYYDKLVGHWENFIVELEATLAKPENNIPDGASVTGIVGDVRTKIQRTKVLVNQMYADGARDALYDQLKPLSEGIEKRYTDMINEARKKGAGDKRVERIFKEFHGMGQEEWSQFNDLLKKQKVTRLTATEQEQLNVLTLKSKNGLSVTREKIEQLLQGDMGDANWFNSYLEGYLYNTDPVVGGLALYVKNALNEVMSVNQQMFNNFADDIRQDLIDAGYDPSKLGRLGERVGFNDEIGHINRETGKFEKKQVRTFLNPFKNYRYAIAEFEHHIEEAHTNWMFSQSDEDRATWLQLKSTYDKFKRDYMHQEYVDEFYDRYELLESDDIGIEAKFRRDQIFERMRALQEPNNSQSDQLMIADEIDLLWREHAQLHSRYDLNGKLKTGEEAEIAKRLRTFREQSREFYESPLRKNVFENAYFDYQQELRNENVVEGSDEWNARMDLWKKRNTRVVIKQEFYTRRAEILDEIKEIMSKLKGQQRKSVDQTAVWEDILQLTDGFKDADGQNMAVDMHPDAIAETKRLEEKLEIIKAQSVLRSGLTKAEQQELNSLFADKKAGLDFDLNRLKALMHKRKTQGLNKFDAEALNALYKELANMSQREATDYYVEIMNNWLSKLNTDRLHKKFRIRSIDKMTAEFLMDDGVLADLFDQDPKFEEWFKNNHIQKEKYDKALGEMDLKWNPLYVWSVVRPTDPSMYESYTVKDAAGNPVETIQGVPTMAYHSRVVKTKYRTRNITGVTKDNQGRFLPKTVADGAADARFINEQYEQLSQDDPNLFRLLEKLKAHHLQNQQQLPYGSRLYMDFPRYRKSNLEVARTTTLKKGVENKVNALTHFAQRVKDFFRYGEDDAEKGMNYESKFNLIRADIFDNEMTGIPISGLYDIPIEDVSNDITLGMMRYGASGNRQRQMISISPIVRAIQNTVNNNDVNDLKKVNKQEMRNRGILRFLSKKQNVRKAAVNNFIEREFEGVNQKDVFKDIAWIQNFSNLLFKRASFSFFALNIPSALKNSLGIKFQSILEASAGRYVNQVTLQKGNAWSYRTMGEISMGQIYEKGSKTHNVQLVEIFDMVQDKFTDTIGESLSRSFVKDAASITWLYTPRKWVEMQATVQLGSGMLYHKKVEQRLPDGSTKEIPYIEAFETINGQIQLKKGIDARYAPMPTYYTVKPGDTLESIAAEHNISVSEVESAFQNVSIAEILSQIEDIQEEKAEELSEVNIDQAEDAQERIKLQDKYDAISRKYDRRIESRQLKIDNTEFKFMKNRMHQVINNMGGAYAKFDQPEAQRYLLFRFVHYMKRYFTAMAVNRWGFSGSVLNPKPRLNPGMGDVHMGFYIRFMELIKNILRHGPKHIMYMTKDEKEAAIKFLGEIIMLHAVSAVISLVFGYRPDDDDDAQAKLREKTGALPFFGLTDKDEDRPDFNPLGYLELHALHLLMQVRAENEQFNLFTGGIQQYNSLLDLKSVAFGPTTDSYVQLYSDLDKMISGDPKAYYSRRVGPYHWQDQESWKFFNHFAKMFGMTGTSVDPALAIQNFQAYQSIYKR